MFINTNKITDRGLYHYWIFLAIKAKIIFLIGTFISFWVFAGKAFAFLYYTTSKKGKLFLFKNND